MENDLLSSFICPQSSEILHLKEGELYSSITSYPIFEGIPWLFKEPEQQFISWANSTANFISLETARLQNIQNKLNSRLPDLTKTRLSKILQLRRCNLQLLQEMTHYLFKSDSILEIGQLTEEVFSYFDLVLRDWCWSEGDLENKKYLKYILQNFDANLTGKSLILGSGAGKLSYLLAKELSNQKLFSLEHNPFLCNLANKITAGNKITLGDYNPFPKDINRIGEQKTIEVAPISSNHLFVSGSFPTLPFKKNSFDLIVAPWFLDAIDFTLIESLRHLLSYLTPNGKLIFIGPSNFHKKNIEDQLCHDEILSIFKLCCTEVSAQVESVNYLNASNHSSLRQEDVLMLVASNPIPKMSKVLTDKDLIMKIIHNEEFKQIKNQQEVYSKILKNINSDIYFDDLAEIIEKEFSFSKKDSIFYAKVFIKNFIEKRI